MTVGHVQSNRVVHGIRSLQLAIANLACTWTVHGVAMLHVLAAHTRQAMVGMNAGRSHI